MKPSRDSWEASAVFRDTLVRQSLIEQVRQSWKEARQADAQLALKQYPKLERHRSCILELAYEEYCFRIEQGENVKKSAFCRRFPTIHKSLARQIEVHDFLDGAADLLPGPVAPVQLGSVVFDEFRVLEELGRGALARVYVCEQIDVGARRIVLKIAHRGGYEADTLGRLKHPHIVPIYSVHEDPTTENTGICMPFQGRSTLCDVIDLAWQKDTPPTSDEVILHAANRLTQDDDKLEPPPARPAEPYPHGVARLGIQLANALHHAHQQGIRHDDLKPSNVLITPSGQAMLMDFNLSTSQQARIALTGGTIPYMSPEQMQKVALQADESGELDFRTDIFSLGVILYELLTGQLPFGEPDRQTPQAELITAQLKQQSLGATPIHERDPDVPRKLSEHVMACLAFARQDRPQDLPRWAARLQQLVDGKAKRKNGLQSGGLAAVAMLMLGSFWAQTESSNLVRSRLGIPLVATAEQVQPPSGASEFEKGRFYLKRGEWAAALPHLSKHADESGDGATYACMALCYDRLHDRAQGAVYRDKALLAGFESAGFYNNIAVTMQRPVDWPQFEKYIARALELARGASVPLYNRARLDYLRYSADRQNYLPQQGAQDLAILRQRFPNNGKIAHRALTLFAVMAKHDPAYYEPALQAMRVACEGGFASAIEDRDDALAAIANDPRFAKWKARQRKDLTRDAFDSRMDPINESI